MLSHDRHLLNRTLTNFLGVFFSVAVDPSSVHGRENCPCLPFLFDGLVPQRYLSIDHCSPASHVV